jgi:hypothetical protein
LILKNGAAMPSPNKKSFALRLDPALHAAIERLASQELRSVNAEIEFLLREALKKRGINLKDVSAKDGAK